MADKYVSVKTVKDKMRYYGFRAPDMTVTEFIEDELLPAADVVEKKKGHWEMKPDPYGFFEEIPVCSECGCTTKWREKYLYCPNCGADMREEKIND